MFRQFGAAVIVVAAAGALSACGDGHDGEYQAVCQDPRTGVIYQDASLCTSPHAYASWYYMPYATWHDVVEVHHYTHVQGGSNTVPVATSGRTVTIQRPGQKKITIYDRSKQAGTPVKNNQDARKVGTVVTAKSSSGGSSYGSYTKQRSNVMPPARPAAPVYRAPVVPKR